jgi:predicted protein tyrosine phosphatase
MKRVLFLCSRNQRRSPTAEQLFAAWPHIEVASAGLCPDAEEVLSPELVAWAEVIFVMESSQRAKLQRRFRAHLKNQRVICLDIPDNFEFMEPALQDILLARIMRFLPPA